MEAPTISKKHAKKTLAGKKTKKETIKNVLAKPYQNYWPLLSSEDNNQMKETLEKLLPKLKNDKITVPYQEIKKISKSERRTFRKKFSKVDSLEINDSDKQNLIFGINDVSRLLENQMASCVLVASDVEPRLFVQHILDQAVLYNVPVLVVQHLRDILKRKCGIGGAVIALKNTAKADCGLGFILQTVSTIYENYPVPETHINYHRRRQEPSAIIISDSENGDDKNSGNGDSKSQSAILSDSENERDTDTKNCHLMRRLDRKRVFVPEKSEPSTKQNTFIQVDTPTLNLNNNRANYRPLLVKRVRGDKNRNNRKLGEIKRKMKK